MTCNACHGAGSMVCPACDGTGVVEDEHSIAHAGADLPACEVCEGKGETECPVCCEESTPPTRCPHCGTATVFGDEQLDAFVATTNAMIGLQKTATSPHTPKALHEQVLVACDLFTAFVGAMEAGTRQAAIAAAVEQVP
ncbi:MAG: hypothetical protein KC620_10070 [Myxococcales bacterium]|nr:hypothetical protein [Myxococcales bacterium]